MRPTLLLTALSPLLVAPIRAQGDDVGPGGEGPASRFAPPADVAIRGLEDGWRPGLAIGDIDNDGSRDVIAVSAGQSPALIPLRRSAIDLNAPLAEPPAATFGPQLRAARGSEGALEFAAVLRGDGPLRFAPLCEVRCHPTLVDIDNDGNLDIVLAQGADPHFGSTAGYFWVPGRGDGTFADPLPFHGTDGKPLREDSRYASDVSMADLDGDGDLDLIRGGPEIHWFALTDAGFDGPRTLGIAGNQPVPVDWDGDGDLDVVAILETHGTDPGPIGWFERNADGGFAPARVLLDGSFASFAVADWDLDTALDLVTVRTESRRAVGGPRQLSDSERRQMRALEEALGLAETDLDALLATSPLGLSRRALAQRDARREEMVARIDGIVDLLVPLRDRARAGAPQTIEDVRVQVHRRIQ